MVKKIVLVVGSLIVIGVVIIMVVPWGQYESDLEKSDLSDEIEFSNDTNEVETVSLDNLEGFYQVDITKGGTAEILFNTDGLKTTKGGFKDFQITFNIAEDYTQSVITVKIKTASLDTGNEMRDEHLVEEEFFDAAAHPEINYKSSSVVLGDTSYIAKGELTLNGTTNALDIPFSHIGSGGEGEDKFEAFEGTFEFDRIEYGQMESSGVGNLVKVNFYCELILE